MEWFVYELAPIDGGWRYLQTVEALGQQLAVEYSDAELNGTPVMELPEWPDFATAWRSAKDAAYSAGWEGDFRGKPVVFWVPAESEFTYGFVFKQDNNGTTYVVSPVELPHLKSA